MSKDRNAQRPNVLLIVVDQLTATLTGAYGHPVVKTPHLDKMAELAAQNTSILALKQCEGMLKGTLEMNRSVLRLAKTVSTDRMSPTEKRGLSLRKEAFQRSINESLDGLVKVQLDLMEACGGPQINIFTLK